MTDKMDRQEIESQPSGEWPNPYDEEIDALDKEAEDDALNAVKRVNATSALLIKSLWGLGEF